MPYLGLSLTAVACRRVRKLPVEISSNPARLLACIAFGFLAGTVSALGTTTTNILLPGTRFATPCYAMDSGNPGPTVMIVGGVHGNETAGALAAEGIRQWPILKGKLIVIPRANVPGLEANKRLIPGLGTNLSNLNRNYPGAGQPDNEARGELAQTIWKIANDEKPDWVLDLHEGFDFHQLNAGALPVFLGLDNPNVLPTWKSVRCPKSFCIQSTSSARRVDIPLRIRPIIFGSAVTTSFSKLCALLFCSRKRESLRANCSAASSCGSFSPLMACMPADPEY